jgi:hypothetical protein
VQPNGKLRPLTYWGGKGLADVRMVSGRFLLSFQDLWERRSDEILDRVADEHPELIRLSQIKLANVTRVEVGVTQTAPTSMLLAQAPSESLPSRSLWKSPKNFSNSARAWAQPFPPASPRY